ALADGSHTLSTTVTDEIGNVSARSEAFTFVVDVTPPEPAGALTVRNDGGTIIADGGITNDSTPAISGTAEAGTLVTVYDGTTAVGSATADGSGAWSITPAPALSDAAHTLNVTVTDAAGNISSTSSITLTVDTTPPQPVATFDIYDTNGATPVLIASDGYTNDDTPVLRGTAEAGATVNIYEGDTLLGTATVNQSGVWRFETGTLTDGQYTFTVSVTDAAGNVSTEAQPYTINVDLTPPAVIADLAISDNAGATTGPLANGAVTDDNTPTLSGTAEAGSVVSVYDGDTLLGSVTAGAGGAWSFTTGALSNGPHSFIVTQTDVAGNVGAASTPFAITIENGLPPTTSTLQLTDDSGSTLVNLTSGAFTSDTTPVLSGTAAAGDVITILDGGATLGSVTVGAGGVWTFTPAALAEGAHSFTITTVDATGNPGASAGPIAITVEGANILTRSMIIFGQGAIRCHPYVLQEMAAAERNDLPAFDRALFSHVGHVGSNVVRSLWLGITGGYTSASPTRDATRRYYQHLNRISANLALLSDVSMSVLGGSLKRRERISARLGDILSQLYLASAALKRYDDEGRQAADLPLLHWGVQDALNQAEDAIDDLLRNFPNAAIAATLRLVIFPTGRHCRAPSDRLDHQLAKLLQTPSATRSRLGRGQYLTPSEHNPAGQLEAALHDVMAAEVIHDRLNKQLKTHLSFTRLDELAQRALQEGWINAQEAEVLKRAEVSRLRSINVDEFEPDALATQPVKQEQTEIRKIEAA
ncbi:MAG: acyl-CoA dehydrogenase domain-containing protein, partial [Mixta calida]|nr:acyl-CoA dehydrogenase domain-containing protein [Mixta calida]